MVSVATTPSIISSFLYTFVYSLYINREAALRSRDCREAPCATETNSVEQGGDTVPYYCLHAAFLATHHFQLLPACEMIAINYTLPCHS